MSRRGAETGIDRGARPAARRLAALASGAWSAGPLLVVAILGLTVAGGALPVAIAWLAKQVLDTLAASDASADLTITVAALVGGVLLTALVPYLTGFVEGVLARRLELRLEDRLFSAVNSVPGMELFEQPRYHDHLQLAQQAAEKSPGQLVRTAPAIGRGAITVGGFAVALAALDWRLALLAIASIVPNMVAELKLSTLRAELLWRLSSVERRRFFYGSVQTDPRAAKELRLFGLGDFLRGRMMAELRTMARAQTLHERRELLIQGGLVLVAWTFAGAALAIAVREALAGRLSVGSVAIVLTALPAMQAALSALVRDFGEVHAATLLLAHHEKISHLKPPVPEAASARPAGGGTIELRDVWFRYAPDLPWILRGLNLTLVPGKSLALVGLNGAGKSTAVKLICGLLQPTRGQVLWAGTDLRELDPVCVRERMSVVFQDFMAYDLTARENVGIGDLRTGFDPPQVERAAGLAGIHETIASLPRGYDSLLTRVHFSGEDEDDPSTGVLLSGGQWQRLAVARAFMRHDCDLLILDEPSAGLDAEAEHALHTQLRRLREGRTSLLISHRLSSIRDANTIAVLDGGRIVESGAHADLVAAGGRYAGLFGLQAAGYQPDLTRPG